MYYYFFDHLQCNRYGYTGKGDHSDMTVFVSLSIVEWGRDAAGKDKNMLCFMESKVFFKSNLLLKRESLPLEARIPSC